MGNVICLHAITDKLCAVEGKSYACDLTHDTFHPITSYLVGEHYLNKPHLYPMQALNEFLNVDLNAFELFLFMAAGILTGIINTMAGSGSLVTLPIFIFICGLPPTVANGTNRIGILVQTLVGVSEFRRRKVATYSHAHWIVIPALVGAIVGSWVAVDMSERAMNTTIGLLMVFMFFVLLLNPKRWIHEITGDLSRNKSIFSMLVFFAIGLYGGFIQAGSGIFILAALVLYNHYSLKAANGIKLLMVLIWTIPVLLIFIYNDQVHWGYGILIAVFQAIGTWLGVRFMAQVPNANMWIHRLLLVVVAAAMVKFFVG